jgi:hypothetical protein
MLTGTSCVCPQNRCYAETKGLIQALVVIASIICFATCFTDTYETLGPSKQRVTVVVVPFYGPVAGVPTPQDEERVFQFFYVKSGSAWVRA